MEKIRVLIQYRYDGDKEGEKVFKECYSAFVYDNTLTLTYAPFEQEDIDMSKILFFSIEALTNK